MMIDTGNTRKTPSYSYVLSVRRSEALFPILLKNHSLLLLSAKTQKGINIPPEAL